MNAIPVATAKKETVEFQLGKRTYKLALTLNAINELQKMYGSLDAVFEKSQQINSLLEIFKILVNEAVDNHNDDFPNDKWEYVDERFIGRKIDITNIRNLKGILFEVFGVSLPEKKTEEDETVVSNEMKELLDEIPEDDDAKNSDTEQA